MKRFLCILLSVVILATASLPVYATSTNNIAPSTVYRPMYTYVLLLSAGLDISGSGLATCGGAVVVSNANYTTEMTIKLQRYTTSWTTIKTWTISGEDSQNETRTYYVTSGYDYRVIVTVKVYSGSTLMETESLTSATRSY